tara:strand:+ start:55 stop:690 length:636 start_codon:yes stop_codon:yes gene_type:complete
MCGIFGSNNYEQLKTLYSINKERGSFAYGYLYREGTGKPLIQRGSGGAMPSSIVDTDDFNYYLGHTQGPTSSEREFRPETSHPFTASRWHVAHNGVLSNYKDLYPDNPCVVDSSVIPYLLNKNDKSHPVATISAVCSSLEGTFACWIYDELENDIYLVRCGSTLFYKEGCFSSKQPDNTWCTMSEGVVYKLVDNDLVSQDKFKSNSPYFIL